MPVFCARWPDGSFSIVGADNEDHALIQLDELGDEPAELWQMESCLLDFELTDKGTFRLKQFGEQTGPEILHKAYPVLEKALESEALAEHTIEDQPELEQSYPPGAAKILGKAVEAERKRLEAFQPTSATTEQGKDIQRAIGGSGAYIDAFVQQAASERLETFKPAKKNKPS